MIRHLVQVLRPHSVEPRVVRPCPILLQSSRSSTCGQATMAEVVAAAGGARRAALPAVMGRTAAGCSRLSDDRSRSRSVATVTTPKKAKEPAAQHSWTAQQRSDAHSGAGARRQRQPPRWRPCGPARAAAPVGANGRQAAPEVREGRRPGARDRAAVRRLVCARCTWRVLSDRACGGGGLQNRELSGSPVIVRCTRLVRVLSREPEHRI